MKTLTINNKNNNPQDVLAANKMLMGHNVFQRQTLMHIQHGQFTVQSGQACRDMKWWLGYKLQDCTPMFGTGLKSFLLGHTKLSPAMHLRRQARKYEKKNKFICPVDGNFKLIGWPGIGTHSWEWLPNNWESDNANDAGCKRGTRIVAIASGVIGTAFGPLSDPDPRFHGIRLHLVTADNEAYYAHLIDTAPGVKPGAHISQGQLLGHSGIANGVEHLHIGLKHGNPTQHLFHQ